MDPEYAEAVAPLLHTPPSATPPTIEQARAHFVDNLITPTKTFHEKRLPPGMLKAQVFRITMPILTLHGRTASAYSVEDRTVTVDGGEIVVRCITPLVSDEAQTFPVLVNIHGGGVADAFIL